MISADPSMLSGSSFRKHCKDRVTVSEHVFQLLQPVTAITAVLLHLLAAMTGSCTCQDFSTIPA